MDREHEDAGDVVERAGALLFGEVSDEMATVLVVFCHDVEEEGFDVVVEGFGSEKEFREKAEVLAVDWVLAAVDFEEREAAVTIDFVAWRVLRRAF